MPQATERIPLFFIFFAFPTMHGWQYIYGSVVAQEALTKFVQAYTGFRIYRPWWDQWKIDLKSEMTKFPK